MFKVLNRDQIPYADQAGRLFNLTGGDLESNGIQRIVPFLGAGVSISGRPPSARPLMELDSLNLEPLFQQLGFTGPAKVFMEMAVRLASLIQARELQDAAERPNQTKLGLLKELQTGEYPPSAGELAQLFSQLANYTTFTDIVRRLRERFHEDTFAASEEQQVETLKLLASVTGIANPPDMLTSITSYFESVGDRDSLWKNLRSVISLKNKPTSTHEMLAAAAQHHLSQKRTLDYLIITTNYDCLMEKALDDLDVPYAVLSTRKSDQKVVVRFSEKIPDSDWLDDLNKGETGGNFANGFVLQKSGDLRNLVVIYKIHGCLYQKLKREDDGVIISDNDYVNYIKQMGKSNIIPSYVNTLMNNKPFLFLGYSLNDWNIRSIFETMREKRSPYGGIQDVSVMNDVGEFEEVFFQRNDILIFKTDLNSFVEGVSTNLPEDVRKRF